MAPQPANHPVNVKERDQDIERKLQLYGVYYGFKQGKMPSNKQCDVAMNSALASKALSKPHPKLSEDGKVLVKDLRDVIEQAKKLMLTKNEGQLIQEFIWSAQNFSADPPKKPDMPETKEGAKQDAKTAGEDLKTLGTLLITNGEFRKLLSDANILVRDIAGDASQNAANKLRPSEEQLSQVDQPAEENLWHEKPDTEKLKSNFKDVANKFKSSKDDSAPEVADAAKQASGGKKSKKAGAEAAAEKTKEKTQENVPEDAKSRTSELADKTKNYLSEKFPEERRDMGIQRLKKMIVEIQGHPEYQRAIETLLSLVEKYATSSRNVSEQGAGALKEVRGNSQVRGMEQSLRTLLERFANSTSMDDLFGSLDNLYRDADEDPELRGFFRDTNTFIRKCLAEKGYVMTEDCRREWDRLSDRGNFLLRDRYRSHTKRILDEIKFFGDQFNQDPQNKAFGDSMQKLFTDLGRGSDGSVQFKKHLLKDIRDVILPGFLQDVRYIPVPRIEVRDPMVDVVVENIVIESDNLMPNVMEFGSDNYFRWGRKKISNKNDNKIMIAASGIQADLRDISYHIKKKEGFPSISDKGVMDILLGGEGFGFKIAASTAQKEDDRHFFKVDNVSVNITNMDIKLKKSKHKILFNIFKPMLFSVVRPAIQTVLQKQIREAFVKGDEFAYEVHLEAKKAERAAKNDPENKSNSYTRHMDALRSKMAAKKEEDKKKPKRDTQIKTAFHLNDSLFPDVPLPGAVSTKATEYVNLAKRGERWESPVFSMGSAKESTDIPAAAPITRKPHQTAESKLEGPSKGTNGAKAVGATGATKDIQAGGDKGRYSSRGFADELTTAIDGDGNGAAATAAANNPPKIQPNTGFNPQAA